MSDIIPRLYTHAGSDREIDAAEEIAKLRKLLKDLLDPPDDAAMYDAMVAARAYFSELK